MRWIGKKGSDVGDYLIPRGNWRGNFVSIDTVSRVINYWINDSRLRRILFL